MLLTQPNQFTTSHRTIKNNHLFLVDSKDGEIPSQNDSGLGLYNLDTRFLSCFEIRLNDTQPVCLLSSTETGYLSTLVYTNGQFQTQNKDNLDVTVLEETIELKRETILDGALFDKYTLTNYNIEAVYLRVSIRFEADFRDMFEIRHLVPYKHRQLHPPEFSNEQLIFRYEEDRNKCLQTKIIFKNFEPHCVDPHTVVYEKLLYPLESIEFNLEIFPSALHTPEDINWAASDYQNALTHLDTYNKIWGEETTEFHSDNEDFNEMLERSSKDLRMLLTQSSSGKCFISAGIPWYVALFGRDSIITSREALILNPSLAKWTLNILAQYQGKEDNPWRDEAPGKILHELRVGELAQKREIPHTPYYGSVDSTPLWLILLYEYYIWTKDLETLKNLWPNALAALGWINDELMKSSLGYLTYKTTSPLGIIHQGWKDSFNSAMYENGLQAEPPIALVEVQGYVYLAKKCLSTLAELLGDKDLKNRLLRECKEFKVRFNRDFWQDDMKFAALGLDSQGSPLRVVSSNPGHCLETGIFTSDHARQTAIGLLNPDMFSGWGIRTLSSNAVAFNPMSYHNGSVWPHDNAIIARGFALSARQDYIEKVFTGLFEAARYMTYKRLPELFCGFPRNLAQTDPPVRYPVACSPQAWSAAAGFSLIHSMLNIQPDLQNGILRIRNPKLPSWLNVLQIQHLRIADSVLDLEFRRAGENVMVNVQKRSGRMDVILKI